MKASGPAPAPQKKSIWETTPEKGVLRNRHSGQFYYRYTHNGKQKWVWLETDVYSVAKLRAWDKRKDAAKLRASVPAVSAGKATMGQLMDVYWTRTQENADLRPSTIVARGTGLKKIRKTWPGIADLRPQQITPPAVQKWANNFKKHGTKFTAPKTRTVRKGNSASSVNRAIDILRHVLDIAIDQGQIHTNPVSVKPKDGRLKKTVEKKKLRLPSREETDSLIAAMRKAGEHGGWGREAALLCSFLRASGARIGEIPRTTWRCVNWKKDELYLPGYKTAAAPRDIPLFAELKVLLREIQEWRKVTAIYREDKRVLLEPNDRIFKIAECQKTIDAACAQTGITRITHHDWRHIFATTCIECGVEIRTVAEWLGHSDGGVLALQTYGHLRREHSHASAKKVTFGAPPMVKSA